MYEIYINDRPLRLVSSVPASSAAIDSATHLVAAWRGKAKTLLNYADMLEKGSPKVTAVTLYYRELDLLWSNFLSHYKIVAAAGGLVRLTDTDQFLIMERRGRLDLPKGKIDPGETIPQAALREVSEETGLKVENLTIEQDWPVFSTDDIKPVKKSQNGTSAGSQLPSERLSTRPDHSSEISTPLGGNYDFTAIMPSDANSLINLRAGEATPFRLTLHTYRSRKGKRILKPTYWLPMRSSQQDMIPQQEEDIAWVAWLNIAEWRRRQLTLYPSLQTLFLPNITS